MLDNHLAEHADVATELALLHSAVWETLDPLLLDLARRQIASILGCKPEEDQHSLTAREAGLHQEMIDDVPHWHRSRHFDERHRACLAFVEQFVMDVASVSDAQARVVAHHLGPRGLVDFAAAVLVLEQRLRLKLTWDRVFPNQESK